MDLGPGVRVYCTSSRVIALCYLTHVIIYVHIDIYILVFYKSFSSHIYSFMYNNNNPNQCFLVLGGPLGSVATCDMVF